MLESRYDGLLVLFSVIVAIFSSYSTLVVMGRMLASSGRAAERWLISAACTLGVGIWSMHFIGMLAFELPIEMGYDLGITVLSLLIAIISSGLALWLVVRAVRSGFRLVVGAVLLGGGLAGMHYVGMAGMRMSPGIAYDPHWVALSVLIAIGGSGMALRELTRRQQAGQPVRRMGLAAMVGLTIVAMHYAGMAAAEFPAGSICRAANAGVHPHWLASTVIIAVLAVLMIALIASVLDERLASITAHQALHDNLTGLPNRTLLKDRVEQAMERSRRENRPFALMFMDLDGFKPVNDAYGHQVGDLLLVAVANRIIAGVRASDTVARVGGDEFVVLLEIGEPSDAAVMARRLVACIREPYRIEGYDLRVSSSIGIAVYPGNGQNLDELLSNADLAMYFVKKHGRDDYCFFDRSMTVNAHEREQLQNDLRQAAGAGQLVLHYQAKFTASGGPVMGVEALLRWNHPQQGLLWPDQFIALAEKTGLIVPVGEWVLDEACRQLAAWRDAGHGHWTMGVNLSVVQLGHDGLVEAVRDALARHGVAPERLILEVTESAAMQDVEANRGVLRQLQALGVRISIDDFGTGYSNLLQLKRLPAIELKIDRSFVQDIGNSSEDRAIVEAIVALGRSLDLKIVAEGVETVVQQQMLAGLGCDSLQGFLLARPLPADELASQDWFAAAGAEP